MKTSSELEIRVALIGYVSVGKTTILNALLKDSFSEVSMKRTTAGINLFRISRKTKDENQKASTPPDLNAPSWTPEDYRSAESTLEEIIEDNQTLRQNNLLQEKNFDIVLGESFMEMRKDTKLVLIDVPGINEAGTSDKYMGYVETKWRTFDCVIVVLDGRQGVNTDDQVKLLEFVKTNCEQKKQVPVIILLNKIDDLAFEKEHQVLVKETTEAIEKMFNVSDRTKALREIVSGTAGSPAESSMPDYTPIVIPLSGRHAYVYRVASSLSLEEFKDKVDDSLVDLLGRDFYGRQWKTFDSTEKYLKAHKIICDGEQYKEGLEESNFDVFLKALTFCVGGTETQEWLIKQQIQDHYSHLDSKSDYVEALGAIYDKSSRLGTESVDVHSKFVELHQQSLDNAFKSFVYVKDVGCLAKPMNEVFSYLELARNMGTLDEVKVSEILEIGRQIVLRQMEVVLSNAIPQWKWGNTAHDWMFLTSAMLGGADRCFFERHKFGIPRMLLEKIFQDAVRQVSSMELEYHIENGKFVPKHKEVLDRMLHVTPAETPQDANHFGHLIWQFSNLAKALDAILIESKRSKI